MTVRNKITHESLAIEAGRSFLARDAMAVLRYFFMIRGVLKIILSNNGPEFITDTKKWLRSIHVEMLYIVPDSTCESGYIEFFNGRPCDNIFNRELFYSVK